MRNEVGFIAMNLKDLALLQYCQSSIEEFLYDQEKLLYEALYQFPMPQTVLILSILYLLKVSLKSEHHLS